MAIVGVELPDDLDQVPCGIEIALVEWWFASGDIDKPAAQVGSSSG